MLVEANRDSYTYWEDNARIDVYKLWTTAEPNKLGPFVLEPDIDIHTATRPAVECYNTGVEMCYVFYVPLSDKLARLHKATLMRNPSTGKFSLIGTVMMKESNKPIIVPGNLSSWRRNSTIYLAYVSPEKGFPATILTTSPSSGANATKQGSWGIVASDISTSRNVVSGAVDVVWTGP